MADKVTENKKITSNYDFINNEKEILKYWEDNQSFKKLQEKNKNGKKYRFIDGPITANNPMGMHHVWGRTLKDTFLRYKAMNGYTSHYRNGFDGQGLWVEVEVEKEFGFEAKKDIEAYGLDKFTEACVNRVKKYSGIIAEQSKRLGQWMDWDNSYYTYKDNNITSIWAVLKKCHENGWLKQVYRPMPWCSRCGTSLSEHEMSGSYKEVEHESVYVKLPLENGKDNILVWTTTPWTLSSNVALAVNPELDYVRVQYPKEDKPMILCKDVFLNQLKKDGVILDTFKGSELAGIKYETMFPELPCQKDVDHRIVLWEDVSNEDGSGVVHIAPGCGAEDFELGKREGLAVIMPIDESGNFYKDFGFLSGKNAKDVAPEVFEKLREQNKLFFTKKIKHSYPVCWRCKREVLFRLGKEWAISVDELRPRLIANARKVKWNPEYQGKRMEDWLVNMTDWNISRKRFYGLPLPFYPCECGHLTVIGSKEELREKAVDKSLVDGLKELHRPWIDDVLITCPHCGKPVKRVTEVGDVWLDAGIVPFSTLKYFEDREYWQSYFPADYVIEMKEQVRLWFYSMLFMSTVLLDEPPYKEVGTHGMVVSENGTRFSKTGFMIRFEEAAEKLGADVCRYIYVSTPATSDVRFGFNLGEDVKRKLMNFWNNLVFFDLYYNIDKPKFAINQNYTDQSDIWLKNRVDKFVAEATDCYENYETSNIIKMFEKCVDDVSNWYIRINRKRFWKSENGDDKLSAYSALYYALKSMIKVMAPILPFMMEYAWLNLVKVVEPEEAESVHLSNYPTINEYDEALLKQIDEVRDIITLSLKLRNESNLKVKQPLNKLYLFGYEEKEIAPHQATLINELNVKNIEFMLDASKLSTEFLTLDFKKAGAALKANVNKVKMAIEKASPELMAEYVKNVKAEKAFEIDGVSVNYDIFKMNVKFPETLSVALENGKGVILDVQLNDELIFEGMYRELLRNCQIARKEANFDISDRIQINFTASEKLAEVIEKYATEIEKETLSKVVAELTDVDYQKEVNLDEEKVLIKLKK